MELPLYKYHLIILDLALEVRTDTHRLLHPRRKKNTRTARAAAMWSMGDVLAGVTVGVLAVPQGISFAQVAGLPAQYGLYNSLIASFACASLHATRT